MTIAEHPAPAPSLYDLVDAWRQANGTGRARAPHPAVRPAANRLPPAAAAPSTGGGSLEAPAQRLPGSTRARFLSPTAPTATREPEEGTGAQRLVPVVGAVGSCGATTLSVALAETLGARLVETCSSHASGVAAATRAERGSADGWLLGLRNEVTIERIDGALASPADVPELRATSASVSVIDAGWDLDVILASSGWLSDCVRHVPVVVVATTATVPGIRKLESAAALLGGPDRMVAVVVGRSPKRWGREVTATAGRAVAALQSAQRLFSIPEDARFNVLGPTEEPLPAPVAVAARRIACVLDPTSILSRKNPTHS